MIERMNTIRRIRCEVFQVSQAAFAEIAGVKQATVSRWEHDLMEPTLAPLGRIRAAAIAQGLPWDDRWFFEAPEADEASQPPKEPA